MTADKTNFEQEREVQRLLGLANLQRMRGQWVDAEDTCRKALEISPKDVIVRELLGDILHEIGKLDKALEEYKTALEISPGKPSLETKFAKLTLEISDKERERELAEDMLINPKKYRIREKKPVLAFIYTAIVPGLGQLYNGQMFKGAIIFGIFLLFMISVALLQGKYPPMVRDLNMFLRFTNPVVLLLGIMAGMAYIYAIIDAPLTADKMNKLLKKDTEPQI